MRQGWRGHGRPWSVRDDEGEVPWGWLCVEPGGGEARLGAARREVVMRVHTVGVGARCWAVFSGNWSLSQRLGSRRWRLGLVEVHRGGLRYGWSCR